MKIIQRKKNPKNKKIIEERQKINTKSEKRASGLQLSTNLEENYKNFKLFLKKAQILFSENSNWGKAT